MSLLLVVAVFGLGWMNRKGPSRYVCRVCGACSAAQLEGRVLYFEDENAFVFFCSTDCLVKGWTTRHPSNCVNVGTGNAETSR